MLLLDCSGEEDTCSIPLPKRLITSAELRLGSDDAVEGDDSDEEEDDEQDGVHLEDEVVEQDESEDEDEDDQEAEDQAAQATGPDDESKVRE